MKAIIGIWAPPQVVFWLPLALRDLECRKNLKHKIYSPAKIRTVYPWNTRQTLYRSANFFRSGFHFRVKIDLELRVETLRSCAKIVPNLSKLRLFCFSCGCDALLGCSGMDVWRLQTSCLYSANRGGCYVWLVHCHIWYNWRWILILLGCDFGDDGITIVEGATVSIYIVCRFVSLMALIFNHCIYTFVVGRTGQMHRIHTIHWPTRTVVERSLIFLCPC
jgi:hypothetical protein